jgi:TPR repeat protein
MWRLDSACIAADQPACDTLGMHHWAGRNRDERRAAVAIWERACSAGGQGACANLALAYDDGDGVKRDRTRSRALAHNACDGGSAPACVTVASMLGDGRVGRKDLAASSALMLRACEMVDLYACTNMGYRSLEGLYGVARDSATASRFFARACAAAVTNHPYPWYRETSHEACALARDLAKRFPPDSTGPARPD